MVTPVSRKGRAQGRLVKGSMVPEPSAAREQQTRCLGRAHVPVHTATSFLLCPHTREKETITVSSLPIRPLPSPGPHPHDLSPPTGPPHLLTHTVQSPGDPLRIWGECTPASFAQAGSREHVPCQVSAGQAGLATHCPVRGAWQRENRPQLSGGCRPHQGTVVTEVGEPGSRAQTLASQRRAARVTWRKALGYKSLKCQDRDCETPASLSPNWHNPRENRGADGGDIGGRDL